MSRRLPIARVRAVSGAALLVTLSFCGRVAADDWAEFRGPGQNGHSTAKNLPLTWSETENVAWKVPVPGLGWSSPSVAGEQIWVTSAVEEGHSLRALAFDRASGKQLIDVEVFHLDDPGSIHANNSHASPTPLVDGDRVFVHYGAHGTACLSTDGKIVWKTQELKYAHQHGPGGSPVVWKDLVFVSCDGTDVQFVVALEKATGKIRWKRDRAHISEERKTGELQVPMAYCTPLILNIDGRDQLVSLGSDAIVAHDPATGEELWWFRYSGYSNVARPVIADGLLYLSTGFGEPVFHCIKPGGTGDITESGAVWNTSKVKGSLVPLDVSPIVVGDELYTISDAGVGVCYDAKTGKTNWTKRLGGKFWASPVFAEGRIYCLNDSGVTYVLAPGKKFEQLAENKLEGASQASPAIVDGAIFLRTDTHLYRIQKSGLAAR